MPICIVSNHPRFRDNKATGAMKATEFQANVENGLIRVSAEYRSRLTEPVRVILLAEERTERKNMIDRLLESPRKVKGFKPLSREKIYE